MKSLNTASVRELSQDEIRAVIGGCKSPGPIVPVPGPILTGPTFPHQPVSGPVY